MLMLMPGVALCAANMAQAEVYRCTDAGGHRHYQDRPCEQEDKAARLDLSTSNLTTIDSATSRREAQGALELREQTRASVVDDSAPPDTDRHANDPGPDVDVRREGDRDDRDPIYLIRPDRDHHHHRRHAHDPPHRPDETPMIDPPRRAGGSYVPAPPTIRQVAPRSPGSATRPSPEGER